MPTIKVLSLLILGGYNNGKPCTVEMSNTRLKMADWQDHLQQSYK